MHKFYFFALSFSALSLIECTSSTPSTVLGTQQLSAGSSVARPVAPAAEPAAIPSDLARVQLMIQRLENLRPADESRPATIIQVANELASLATARLHNAINADINVGGVQWQREPSDGQGGEQEVPVQTPQRDARQMAALSAPGRSLLLEADAFFALAVRHYQMLQSYSASALPQMDLAVYSCAVLLGEFKREEAARQQFFQLIRQFPTSQYVTHAYLWFADYFFGRSEMPQAQQFYQRVVTLGGDLQLYAQYKLAWCALNLGEPDRAAQLFATVAMRSNTTSNIEESAATLQSNARIRDEALSDLANVLAQSGSHTNADTAFQTLASVSASRENSEVVATTRARALRRACSTAIDVANWVFAARMCVLAAPHVELGSLSSSVGQRCVALDHAKNAALEARLSPTVQADIENLRVQAQCQP